MDSVYLGPLNNRMAQRDCCEVRYMDDWCVLGLTRWKFWEAVRSGLISWDIGFQRLDWRRRAASGSTCSAGNSGCGWDSGGVDRALRWG